MTASPWLKSYRANKNAADLVRQSRVVWTKATGILDMLRVLENELYWSLSGEPNDETWPDRLIEQAHALVDQAHEFRAALKANPAPKEEDAS